MPLTSILRHHYAALLAATLTLACGPKNSGDPGGSSDGSSGPSTTGPQECTPGDTKFGEGDCSDCVCSAQGTWDCNRCAPTSGPLETSTSATATDATDATGATTSATTTTGLGTTAETTTGSTGAGETAGDGFLPNCFDLDPSDNFDIVAAQIVGDELVVEVGYSGGCEPHDFTLCFDSIVLDTQYWNLAIDHDAHGDSCEAFIMESRKFDLTPLQQTGPSPFEFFLLGFVGDSFTYEY